MSRGRDNVVPFRRPLRAVPLRRAKTPPKRPRPAKGTWRRAVAELRPGLLLIALAAVLAVVGDPRAYEPPAWLQTAPQKIEGRFTRCGLGRGYYCVIDGDTFKMGAQSVRVVGIDTAEAGEHARCAREASQAEASTLALQRWLNRASFRLTARLDEPIDRYGRSLRIVKRLNPDGSEDRLADYMVAEGGAHWYWGRGWRGGWC
jgi:endonuclease YncB( thermonuclease family)